MDKHPGGSCDAPSHFMLGILCDGLASRPGGVVILLVTLYSVSCDGLTSRPGRTVILLVNLYWVSCDGIASNPGGKLCCP